MNIESAIIKEQVQEQDHHNMIDDANTAIYNNEDGNDDLAGAISDVTLFSPLPPPIIVHINNRVNEKEDDENHEQTIDGNTDTETDTDTDTDTETEDTDEFGEFLLDAIQWL
mmetsp:Transcript_29087/g.32672  ORF Transcript_29087/g.32672 Transcript_29087/m.32672 type:complete len:112 (-) Transcript_29087:275-610(-)